MGGPTYFIRNAMYNLTFDPFKLNRGSRGDVILHNTAVKVGDGLRVSSTAMFDHALFRNNLCIGGPPGNGAGAAMEPAAARQSASIRLGRIAVSITTLSAPTRHLLPAQFVQQRFASFEGLLRGPHETHAVKVDLSVFDNVAFPNPPLPERDPADLRPKAGSVVVDAGVRLPNINDDFQGAGPDMGAYEAGESLPHYGPRPRSVDEQTAASSSRTTNARVRQSKHDFTREMSEILNRIPIRESNHPFLSAMRTLSRNLDASSSSLMSLKRTITG